MFPIEVIRYLVGWQPSLKHWCSFQVNGWGSEKKKKIVVAYNITNDVACPIDVSDLHCKFSTLHQNQTQNFLFSNLS